MPQYELAEASEVGDRVVGERGCLVTFFSHKADANVRRLDHVDVIRTISDRKGDFTAVMSPNELDNLFLLLW